MNARPEDHRPSHGEQSTSKSDQHDLGSVLHKHDEDRIDGYNKEMDTLLVFAGLLSAILSAFNIEAYKLLREDPAEISNLLLKQLIDVTFNSSLPPAPPTISTPAYAITVNILWFISLIFSLVTASLAIFVKQWLRQYLAWGCISEEEQVRVRYVRYEGLRSWKVFEIAALLPFLLQISLLLFFAGLSRFLFPLNRTVRSCTTAAVFIWFGFYLVTILASAFSSSCPYVTPLPPFVTHAIRLFVAGKAWRAHRRLFLSYYQFPGDERGTRRDGNLDVKAYIAADGVIADDGFLVTVLKKNILRASAPNLVLIGRNILEHRLGQQVRSFYDPIDYGRIASPILELLEEMLSLSVRAGAQVEASLHDEDAPPQSDQDFQIIQAGDEALAGLCSIMNHVKIYGRNANNNVGESALTDLFRSTKYQTPSSLMKVLAVAAADCPVLEWNFGFIDVYGYPDIQTVRDATSVLVTLEDSKRPDPLRLCVQVFSLYKDFPPSYLETLATCFILVSKDIADELRDAQSMVSASPDWGGKHALANYIMSISNHFNAHRPGLVPPDLIRMLSEMGSETPAPKSATIIQPPHPYSSSSAAPIHFNLQDASESPTSLVSWVGLLPPAEQFHPSTPTPPAPPPVFNPPSLTPPAPHPPSPLRSPPRISTARTAQPNSPYPETFPPPTSNASFSTESLSAVSDSSSSKRPKCPCIACCKGSLDLDEVSNVCRTASYGSHPVSGGQDGVEWEGGGLGG